MIMTYLYGTKQLLCHIQVLKVLKDMHQYNAFRALLAVALSEANKVNAAAQAAKMCHLEVAILIAAGATAEGLAAGQQVLYCHRYCEDCCLDVFHRTHNDV